MASASCRSVAIQPARNSLTVISRPPTQPVRFDAAFLDRRMREHREAQAQQAAQLATEIIIEVAIALEEL